MRQKAIQVSSERKLPPVAMAPKQKQSAMNYSTMLKCESGHYLHINV